jgi:hypothetical protein
MRAALVALHLTALLLAGTSVSAADHAGIVKNMAGEVTITRGSAVIAALPNTRVYEGDLIQTGSDGKAGLILDDDTVISLGSGSRLAITSFLFQPKDKKLSLIVRVYRGTISFLSGQIARLAPTLVHIETPNATVGVRGTHVLVKVDQ